MAIDKLTALRKMQAIQLELVQKGYSVDVGMHEDGFSTMMIRNFKGQDCYVVFSTTTTNEELSALLTESLELGNQEQQS